MGETVFLREVGSRISARRKELCMTQERLAEIMDVSIQMISNLELGKKAIRPENLVKLSTALGVSTDYILKGELADWEVAAFLKKYAALSKEKQALIDRLIESWIF